MTQMKKNLDLANTIAIALTFILFAIALFTTGFTKELLLEAGVLLISVKIIAMGAANKNSNKEILKKLKEINEKLQDSKSNEPL
jgi:ABC-type transport system involved in cytochrome bd biosynthesis fused ATPase/permease subunit